MANLCGPMDSHIRSIEAALQVKVAHRFEQFRIEGPKARAEQEARTAARMITIISALLLGGLFLAGSYVEPYRTPLGQVLLTVFMSLYLAALVWMGRISATKPLPRFIGTAITAQPATDIVAARQGGVR